MPGSGIQMMLSELSFHLSAQISALVPFSGRCSPYNSFDDQVAAGFY